MAGELISYHFPYLPVRVYVGSFEFEGDALLDTGFDGGICFPDGYLDDSISFVGNATWTLADGREHDARTYVGAMSFSGLKPFRVSITVMGDEVLLGTQAIRHFSVILDHGRRVIVEP